MTSKKFYTAIFVAALAFAVFAVGGCGGSGGSDVTIPETETTNPESNPESETPEVTQIPAMTNIFGSEEYAVVMQDLYAELSADNLTVPNIHFITILSGEVILDDSIESSSAKGSPVKGSALSQDEIQKLADALKKPYESGDVIALFWPSNVTVNDLCIALGEQPALVDLSEVISQDKENQPDSEDLYPEIYAMSKRYNGSSAHTFSYIVPGNVKIMTEVLVEMFSEDLQAASSDVEVSASETSSDNEIEYFNEKFEGLRRDYVFQSRRYADFIRWAAHIDKDMEEQKAEASSVFKSAAASTNLFDYSAQKISVNFDEASTVDWWGTKRNYSYSAGVSYTVYSYHDFGDGKDYYVVRSSVYVKPDVDQFNAEGSVFTWGSMMYWSYTHDLNNGNPSYVLFNNAPPNVNRSKTVSSGTSHSTSSTTSHSHGTKIGSKISASLFDGLSAELSTEISEETTNSATKGTSYSHSETWTTDEYSITNECDNKAAKWTVDFKDPAYETGGPDGYFSHWDGSIQPASARRTDLNSEWMWQVSDSNRVMNLSAHLYRRMRIAWGNGKSRGYNSTWGTRDRGPFQLAQPPHIVLTSEKACAVNKYGGNNFIFRFICDDDWEIISTAPEWCYVSDEQKSGTRTNGENVVFFYVDPYDTGSDTRAHTRQALLVVRNKVTKQVQTVLVTQSNR